jgi:uncharacterized protein
MNNFKIIFIHGYTASHLADWYPQISEELKKLNIDFAIPDLPGHTSPHASEWLQIIHNEIIKSNKPLVIVGHSLGTRAALLYLEKYKPQNIQQVILIAAFANRIENALRRNGEAYPDFFEHTIKINEVKKYAKKFVVIHSKDDSSIPFEQGAEIANDLNAKLITYNGHDHFIEPENAKVILKELKNELSF